MIKEIDGKLPNIHKDTFVALSADIIGDVTLNEGSSIWFGAVARGDINSIEVGKFSNIQDNVSLHNEANHPLQIGDYTTVGHNAVVHGCTIGNNCLIGMGSIILNGAVIGNNCLIGAGSVVTEGMNIPPNSLVMGTPARVKRELTEAEIQSIKNNSVRYNNLWKEKYVL
ncbi:MAG: gamma carbonic anhydrase family protein [Tissierellaceae bacterium]|nr:gamma carbonic anhydrase family protein [Tissierellaceae bacterium]